MKDYQTAKARLSNLDTDWFSQTTKDLLITTACCIVFLVLLTQPNGVI